MEIEIIKIEEGEEKELLPFLNQEEQEVEILIIKED